VIIDHVEDLDVRVVRQAPVRDVGLPHLIRQVRLEADQAAGRPLLWLRDDQTLPPQDSPDRRDRWHHVPLDLSGEMMRDRVRTGIVAFPSEPLAQRDDRPHDLIRRGVPAGLRSSGTGLQSLVAVFSVAGQQLIDPAAVHPMRCRQLADRPPLQHMSLDQKPRHPHRRPPSFGVSYVLTQLSPMWCNHTPPLPLCTPLNPDWFSGFSVRAWK
jgi:hypothetical protein